MDNCQLVTTPSITKSKPETDRELHKPRKAEESNSIDRAINPTAHPRPASSTYASVKSASVSNASPRTHSSSPALSAGATASEASQRSLLSTSIQLSSESQSGKAEQVDANALILSAGLSEFSSSSSVSDSQSAASSVLLGDTHLVAISSGFTPQPANARNGCSKSCAAVHRLRASRAKHMAKKTSSMSLQGARPVAISTTVQPRAQTSAAGPCSSPRATSGAMKAGVPPMGRSESTVLAHPKSASFARPSAPTTTFLPLRSPWTSDIPWRYASPLATSAAYARMAHSSSRPPLLSATSATEPPGANSRNSWHSPESARKPRHGRTCGELRPDRMSPSRLSCSAPAARADLTAKSAPERSAAARDTTAPEAPRPSVRTRVHLPLTAVSISSFLGARFSRKQ
ncbi:hypothetical protein BRADI_2g47491v3 [Brachypodium distachyon]|uniref:Uncharacterized protein n=1 Tax=Brachypodium distachyon TaxID=15368 RepID=A0A2K2DED8_BRADI|nr:hypothetical protein BRADI_2g47491v3 [Brachypodium distachyon]